MPKRDVKVATNALYSRNSTIDTGIDVNGQICPALNPGIARLIVALGLIPSFASEAAVCACSPAFAPNCDTAWRRVRALDIGVDGGSTHCQSQLSLSLLPSGGRWSNCISPESSSSPVRTAFDKCQLPFVKSTLLVCCRRRLPSSCCGKSVWKVCLNSNFHGSATFSTAFGFLYCPTTDWTCVKVPSRSSSGLNRPL